MTAVSIENPEGWQPAIVFRPATAEVFDHEDFSRSEGRAREAAPRWPRPRCTTSAAARRPAVPPLFKPPKQNAHKTADRLKAREAWQRDWGLR